MGMPRVRFIDAEIGTSIVLRAKGVSLPTGLLYGVVFEGSPILTSIIKKVSRAYDEAGLGKVDFMQSGKSRLVVEPPLVLGREMYKGFKILQKLFKPAVPHTAIVFPESETPEKWNIQLSILGGFLARYKIDRFRTALQVNGAKVTEVLKSAKQQADVFRIVVPARDSRARHSYLNELRESCGIFATIQKVL